MNARNPARRSLRTRGAGAVGGMLIGVSCQIFVVPGLFVAFEYLQEKFKPIEKTVMDVEEVMPELEQYTNIEKE